MNLVEAVADNGQASIGGYRMPVDAAASKRMKGNVTVGVRPENWRIVDENAGEGVPLKVSVVEDLGADAFVHGTIQAGKATGGPADSTPGGNVVVRVQGRNAYHRNDTIMVSTDPHHVHVFDTDTGERLSD